MLHGRALPASVGGHRRGDACEAGKLLQHDLASGCATAFKCVVQFTRGTFALTACWLLQPRQ